MVHVRKNRRVQIARGDGRVQIFEAGELKLDLPWEAALEISRGLHEAAKKEEQKANLPQVIADQTLLLRAGAPVQLTHTGLKEAVRLAEYGPYNRYLPSSSKLQSIPSKEVFGLPSFSVRKKESS